MSDLPLPVRLAAGLVVTAMEQARTMPQQLAGLPMTVVSRALQASMRAQQQLTDLAIKGDTAFAALRPVEEAPAWAHFDEDEHDDFGSFGSGSGPADAPVPADAPAPADGRSNGTADLDIGADESELTAAVLAPTPAAQAAAADPAAQPVAAVEEPTETASGGNGLPLDGFAEMSVAQLRGKLRALSLPQLESLLAYENDHGQRPAFVTMLTNRITTVRTH